MKKTNALILSDILAGYYKPTPGSMAFSLAIMATLIGPDPQHLIDDPLLTHRVEDALEKANEATSLTFAWDAHQRLDLMQRTAARNADAQTDRAVSTLYNAIDNYRKSGPGDPEFDIADKLINLVMPQGVNVITGQRYEDQHAAIKNLLIRLDGPGKDAVQELKVEHFVEKLRDLNILYGQKLTSIENEGITHQQVKVATALALEAFALVVITVWATLPDENDRELRNKILAPLHEQNGRFRLHYTRQRNGVKINPPKVNAKTGEFSDQEEFTPTENNGPEIYPHLPGGLPHDHFASENQQTQA